MPRYKGIVAYDGTEYAGFQVQPNAQTVQGEIEKALQKMAQGEFIRIHGAGRTDSGVHAKGQVFHFDYPKELPTEAFLKGLNALTKDDLVFLDVQRVDESFHARYSAKGKMYQYKVVNASFHSPFLRHYALHHSYEMNLESVKEALSYLVGEHDFSSFCAANTSVENKVRTVTEASVEVDESSKEWTFTFRGTGFLYNMIRIIMGTVLEVADGRRAPEEMKQIVEGKNREMAGPTAPPQGLYMVKVYYDEEELHAPRNIL